MVPKPKNIFCEFTNTDMYVGRAYKTGENSRIGALPAGPTDYWKGLEAVSNADCHQVL